MLESKGGVWSDHHRNFSSAPIDRSSNAYRKSSVNCFKTLLFDKFTFYKLGN